MARFRLVAVVLTTLLLLLPLGSAQGPLMPAGSPPPAAAAETVGEPRFGQPETMSGFGNPAGGAPGSARCGQYALTALTGYLHSPSDYLRGVAAACSPVLSDGSTASVGERAQGAIIGRTEPAVRQTTACPPGSLATGVKGRAGLLVDQVQLVCSDLQDDGSLGEAQPADGVAGGPGGSAQPDVACPAGSVVTGVEGRSGDGLDYLTLVCASLTFVVDSALRFDGTSGRGRVVAQYSPLLEQPSDFTLSADVRWDGQTLGLTGIVSQPRSDSAGDGLAEGESLALLDGRPCLRVVVGSVTTELRSVCAGARLPTGNWVHVVAAYTGTVGTVAVNGVTTAATWSQPGTVSFGENDPLVIGGLFAADTGPSQDPTGFGGELDNVSVAAGVSPQPLSPRANFAFDEGSGSLTSGGTGSDLDASLEPAASPADQPAWVVRDGASVPDNTSWPTAATIVDGVEVDGALLQPGQARWYRFAVQPDARVQVDLTDLPADYDVTLFKDIGQAFTALTTRSDLDTLSAEFAGDAFAPSVFSPSVFSPSVFSPSVFSPSVFSPSVFSPSVFSPSVFSPSVFSPSVFSPSVFSPSVFSPSVFSPSVFSPSVFSPSVFSPSVFSPSVFADAFSSAQTRSLIAVSARDGLADESVASSTWDNTGFFYVRVVGRGGASSPSAYHLRLTTSGGACTAALSPRTDLASVSGTPGSAAAVILTDTSRLRGSQSELATVRDRLAALAQATSGVVVDLASVPRVVALNAQADDVPACPYAENLVAQAVREIVNSYRDGPDGTGGRLRYVVLAGGDDVIPFFRYPDAAGLGPESGYVPPVRDETASQASLRRNTFLSQDAYGARVDVSTKAAVLPVPDLAVGRLVETPAEIAATVSDYLALPAGALPEATSSLVTGYDFLTDAADAVASTLSSGIPGGRNETLITDQGVPPTTTTPSSGPTRSASWTATDLRRLLLGSRHDVTFLAGHFSANSALAADYSTSVLTTDLANAQPGTFRNTLVLSAGCHSGYNLLDNDGVPGLTVGLDWAQAFAAQGATLVAGTGYQYGDTDFLEYSERLYAGLLAQLRARASGDPGAAVAIGTALTKAKQEYLAATPAMRGIHVKAVLEATLFGLPMLGVDLPSRVPGTTPTSAVTPQPVTSGPGAATLPSGAPGLGLQEASLHLEPTLQTRTRELESTDGTSVTATYLTGPDGVAVNPAEPALPLDLVDVTAPGQTLRGVALRGATYADTDAITPLTGAATTETNSVHAPFVSPGFYPSRLAIPNYYDAIAQPGGGSTRLAVTLAQHRSDGSGVSSPPTNTLRRYDSVDLALFYSSTIASFGGNTPALAAPPSIDLVTSQAATAAGGSVPVRVRVTGDPSAGIQQVWVSLTGISGSPLHGRWTSVDLVQDETDSTSWSGVLDLPAGQASDDVRFIVQAVNGVGLVSVDDARGLYYVPGTQAATLPAQPPAQALLSVDAPSTGTYGGSVRAGATLTTAGGSALAGRQIWLTVGTSSAIATTGADGRASADLPLLDLPGSYAVQASFVGDDTGATGEPRYAAARADGGDLLVRRQPTSLTLTGPPAPPLSGADSGVRATLTAAGLTEDSLPVRAKTVSFAVRNAASQVVAVVARTTDVFGQAALGPLALPAGTYSVTATFGSLTLPTGQVSAVPDPVLADASATIALTLAPPGPATITTVSGSGQVGTAGQPFDAPLVVLVRDSSGAPVPGADVTFAVTSGSARFGAAPTTVVATGSDGKASAVLTAGSQAGPVAVTARVAGVSTGAAFTGSVISIAAARSDLRLTLSAPATAARGSTFTATLTVRNAGPNTASTMATALTAGPSLSIVAASGGTISKGVATFTATGLPVAAVKTYTLTLRATNTKALTSSLAAATASLVPDPALANNAAAVQVRLT